ncbi:MAG: hypothetical protein KDB25_08935 [Leucobacter sp.]|nr:hypothetical protein [Leucobacter sp.]
MALLTVPSTASPVPPHPPRYDRWPVAMRSAARLHGALVPCGPGFRGIGWPETPRVRANALAEYLIGGRVATHLTAAWVWGAARDPGRPIRVSTAGRKRVIVALTEQCRIAQLRLTEGDIHAFGEFRATTPFRTVLDLLHDPEGFGLADEVACRLLVARVDGGWAAVDVHVRTHRRPGRGLARERLDRITRNAAVRGSAAISGEPTH